MASGEFGTSSFVHRFWDFGFPFSMFSGMYAVFSGDGNFLAFIFNIIFAIIFSLLLGLIFKHNDDLKSLIKSKFFTLEFSAGIILLIILNILSYFLNRNPMCFDCIDEFGFPFIFGNHGGMLTDTEISWYLLSKNLIIGGLFSFYFGYFVGLFARNRLVKKNI